MLDTCKIEVHGLTLLSSKSITTADGKSFLGHVIFNCSIRKVLNIEVKVGLARGQAVFRTICNLSVIQTASMSMLSG